MPCILNQPKHLIDKSSKRYRQVRKNSLRFRVSNYIYNANGKDYKRERIGREQKVMNNTVKYLIGLF